jgi:hypothetical protein
MAGGMTPAPLGPDDAADPAAALAVLEGWLDMRRPVARGLLGSRLLSRPAEGSAAPSGSQDRR